MGLSQKPHTIEVPLTPHLKNITKGDAMAKKKKHIGKAIGIGAATLLVGAILGFGIAQIPVIDNAITLDNAPTTEVAAEA